MKAKPNINLNPNQSQSSKQQLPPLPKPPVYRGIKWSGRRGKLRLPMTRYLFQLYACSQIDQ
jgi:hypothetical protein